MVLSSSSGAFSHSAVTNSPGPNPAPSVSRHLCPDGCPMSWPWPDPPQQHRGPFPHRKPAESKRKTPCRAPKPPAPLGARPAPGDANQDADRNSKAAPGDPQPHGVGHGSSGWLPGAGKGRRFRERSGSVPTAGAAGKPHSSQPVLPDGPDSSRLDLEPRRINSPGGLLEPQLL